ncbi:hypothetical protein F5888DRAFT_1368497 [Russula emetica]|nr:hypothetical protein F5888DRAFT_1368497 [Russula emetica]
MSSSETTRILFNSPALHSLKRDQLVKLCKLHSIKASGKNTELVEKLKRHATTLPLGSPLSVATRSEQPQDDANSPPQRPSEQWEIVMEDIPHIPGGISMPTGDAPDEFGTGGGSKPSSVSSSLRVIANSFNFKRATSSNKSDDDRMVQSNISDELASHSVPYSSIPESSPSDMPQTDHFKFTTPDTTIDEHIPVQPGHPTPAPSGSTTGPLKTTIRLVSASNSTSNLTRSPGVGTPQLRPVDPPFDLLIGSPDARGQSRVPVWPLSPQRAPSEGRLYPTLPADELDEAKRHQERSILPGNTAPFQPSVGSTKVHPKPSDNVQDLFSPGPRPSGRQKERVGIPRSEPFLFGSPLPRHSVSNKAFDTAAASILEEMNKRLSAAGVQKVGVDVFGTVPVTTAAEKRDFGSLRASGTSDRFDKIHEEQFNKMDSIANHYAAKRGVSGSKKRKSDVLGHGSAPAKKRSSAAPHKRMGIPEEDRRMSKRVRVLEEDGGKDKGRRLTISPKKSEAEAKQAERERAATRKMLEVRKGKRRSSRHARASHVGPQAVSNKGKATPRFGILSSAKSIVRSVWNFGVGSPTKASKTSTTTVTTAATKSQTATLALPKETKPVAPPPKKPSLPAGSRPLEAPLAYRKCIAPVRASSSASSKALADGVAAKGRASQSRQPSLRISSGTTRMLNPAPVGGSIGSRQSIRASVNAASSTGMAAEGTNNSSSNKSSNDDSRNKASIFSPSRTTSRLFAPTASSLAKMRGSGTVSKSKTSTIIAQRAKTPPRNAVLDAITNSPRGGNSITTSPPPPRDKIFTTPLLLPVKPSSLAAAASALAATTRSGTQSPERPLANRTTTTVTTTTKGQLLSARKPRISRSRIIAKLGAQRAAATTSSTATSSSSRLSSSRPTVATAAGSKIPRASGGALRAPRVRSSMATATRRSYAGAKSAGRGSDVLMSAKKLVRQSEFVRRRNRMTGSAVGVASGAGGSHAVDCGTDGSMAMDLDED